MINERVIDEVNFLIGHYNRIIAKAVDVEYVINLVFAHSERFTFATALEIFSTLCMLDLISKSLYDELVKALKELY